MAPIKKIPSLSRPQTRNKTRSRKRVSVCVFCGSSHGRDPAYTKAAKRMGALLAENGYDLVFGGGGVGLMGEMALSMEAGGGGITGIIPSFLRHLEPPLKIPSRIETTETMNARKSRMSELADAFVVLPGGFGTLDEFADVLTGAQLHRHAKPIILVNVKNYFAPLLKLIDHFIAEEFVAPAGRKLFKVAASPEEAIRILRERGSSAPKSRPSSKAQAPSRRKQK